MNKLIMDFEGFVANPYFDPATGGEPITIGYGTTIYSNGKKVTMKDPAISITEAMNQLQFYINRIITPVIKANVKQPLNANQIEALESFIYNLGPTNFKSSTLLKKININPNDPSIANEFRKWNKANSKVMAGLTRRREAEAKLYFS